MGGWGETERLVEKLLRENESANATSKPVVATKFTPSPWRTKASDVVKACEESLQRTWCQCTRLLSFCHGIADGKVHEHKFGRRCGGCIAQQQLALPLHQPTKQLRKQGSVTLRSRGRKADSTRGRGPAPARHGEHSQKAQQDHIPGRTQLCDL